MTRYFKWLTLPALIAFVLGVLAYQGQTLSKELPPYDLWDAAYRSLQLFVLNREDQPGVDWRLQVARFLAPATTATGMLLIFESVAKALALWWRSRRGHHIVCGLGRKGLAFVRAARAEVPPIAVVAIEQHADEAGVASATAAGASVVIGDAADPDTLKKAGIKKASTLVVTCGDDDQNVRVLLQALHSRGRQGAAVPLKLVPHISRPEVRSLLRERVRELDRDVGTGGLELADYCHAERAARSLFHDHPLDHSPIGEGSPRFPELILLGFGQTGQAVLLQALKIAHYPNGKLLRAAIFDMDLDRNWAEFVGRHGNLSNPSLMPIATIERHAGNLLDPQVMNTIARLTTDPHADVTIVVALDCDSNNIAVIERLPMQVRHRHVPVHVRIHERGGIAELLRHYRSGAAPREVPRLLLNVFGEVESTSTVQSATFPHDDDFAKRIHARYLENTKPDKPPRRSQLVWEDLDEPFRDSNRHAADYAPVIFRSFGFEIAPKGSARGPKLVDIRDPALRTMGRMEHMRWYAERYLAGWQYSETRDDTRLLHPDMVEWGRLSTATQEKDLDQIAGYVGDLKMIDCVIVKRSR